MEVASQLTREFHVALHLFRNRSQMASKWDMNENVTRDVQPSVSLMFLPHFDVICDLLLNRLTETWNLFFFFNDKKCVKCC